MVESARAEASRDGAGEDSRRDTRAPAFNSQDERKADTQCGVEAKFVEHPPQPGFHTGSRRDHAGSLRTPEKPGF